MNKHPSITVLMAVYNAEKYLEDAINSVLSQTFEDFEFLILDDGSTDCSREIVRTFNDPRICFKSFRHAFVKTLNRGIDMACGKYIARMDADDIMMPNRLQVQYDFMEKHNEIIACGSYITYIGYEPNLLKRPIIPDEIFTSLMLYCTIANPSSIISRKILIDNNIRYNSHYTYAEDYKFWTELAKHGQLANIPQVLLKYRISNTQVSVVHKQQQLKLTRLIQREMIMYFLSHIIENGNEYVEEIKKILIPQLGQLLDALIISFDVYTDFMYTLVCELRKEKMICI